jgi:hypothetical protein
MQQKLMEQTQYQLRKGGFDLVKHCACLRGCGVFICNPLHSLNLNVLLHLIPAFMFAKYDSSCSVCSKFLWSHGLQYTTTITTSGQHGDNTERDKVK